MKTIVCFLALSCLLLSLTACLPNKHKPMIQQQLFTFGTLVDISIVADKKDEAEKTIQLISRTFETLHKQWHPWQDGDLGQANKAFVQPQFFSTSKSIIQLIRESQQLSRQSDGLFNPAIGQLIKLWQFDKIEDEHYHFTLPDADKITQLLKQKPTMSDIIIQNTQIKSNNSALSLDFGAYAKGVAIEQMIRILKKHQINNALINAGGDLKVLGTNNGKAWRIGIKNPEHSRNPKADAIIAAIELKDKESLFTSGDYERFFDIQGKHYHHIIDPRTGYPALGTQSVTILTEDAALADAASTALFIAGPKLWPDIAKKMRINYVMLIADNGQIYLSSAMAQRIHLLTEKKPIIIAL
jgi:thiamine biosynthesis lipoprotein